MPTWLAAEQSDEVESGYAVVHSDEEDGPVHTIKYVHWQEGDGWLGYLEEYPDYWTQGETLADLVEHLKDLYLDLSGGHVPGARKVGELVVP